MLMSVLVLAIPRSSSGETRPRSSSRWLLKSAVARPVLKPIDVLPVGAVPVTVATYLMIGVGVAKRSPNRMSPSALYPDTGAGCVDEPVAWALDEKSGWLYAR